MNGVEGRDGGEGRDTAHLDIASPEIAETAGRDRPDGDKAETLAAIARHYLHQRRERVAAFAPDLFGEPAWDILLNLYVSSIERREFPVSSAWIAAGVSQTTALRWIDILVFSGLVVKTEDMIDRRQSLLMLADGVAAHIEDWITETWPASC